MQANLILEIIRAVWREFNRFKVWFVALFMLISFSVLVVGYFWPSKFVSSALLYADETNIIQPLLEGRAAVTQMDRGEQAREMIYTRRIMEAVAKDTGIIKGDEMPLRQDAALMGLRGRTKISTEGKNYFRVQYSDFNPDRTYAVLTKLINVFIRDSVETKQDESRSAYRFIDQQVNSYQKQLQDAERSLKEFKSTNIDGDEATVSARIATLRMDIEELKLDVDELDSRRSSIRQQINNESKFLASQGKADAMRERLAAFQTQLDTLRLSYQDSYPDIVSLKEQIADLQWDIDTLQSEEGAVGSTRPGNSMVNPLYEELRADLSDTEVALRTAKNRLKALQGLLQEEYARAGRVAENQAELTELTRDYDVTLEIYEEMLGRKEKARLSMTLDIEGQGVSYKIQEPASFPLMPSGLRFIHFAMLGPILGVLLPFGLLVAYVILDPRVRFPSMLPDILPKSVNILGVIPHMSTPLTTRLFRLDILVTIGFFMLASAVYLAAVIMIRSGVI